MVVVQGVTSKNVKQNSFAWQETQLSSDLEQLRTKMHSRACKTHVSRLQWRTFHFFGFGRWGRERGHPKTEKVETNDNIDFQWFLGFSSNNWAKIQLSSFTDQENLTFSRFSGTWLGK